MTHAGPFAQDDEAAVNNIVLVGTKLDLVQTGKKEREVTYEEAVQFAKRMRVAAVVETSS